MKKLLLSLAVLCFSFLAACQSESPEHKRKKQLKQILVLLAADYVVRNQVQYEQSSCSEYSPAPNIGYPVYWPNFHNDVKQYNTVIIGDSTMDISSRYGGFLGTGTQSVAIGGNTACDVITQLPAINTASPSVIILSTNGGNDMMAGVSDSNVINTVTMLIKRLHQKYPSSKLVVVGVHPTLVAYGNAHKATVNTAVQNALNAEYPASQRCYVNPLVLFGVVEGAAANSSDMLTDSSGKVDSIHYNQAMSFAIKNKIQTDCSITF